MVVSAVDAVVAVAVAVIVLVVFIDGSVVADVDVHSFISGLA